MTKKYKDCFTKMNTETLTVKGKDIINIIRNLIEEGSCCRICIRDEEKIILDLPITVIGASVYFAPLLSGCFLVVSLFRQFSIDIYKDNKK